MNALGDTTRSPKHITTLAQPWRPWRAYAVMRLWTALESPDEPTAEALAESPA
jgi:AraC family transcriptional regulator of adaptative response / DNA-3-methyladenine glycosylase II